MSERKQCEKCNGTGYETYGEYRFICGDCRTLKTVITKLEDDEILFACRQFQEWIRVKYDNHYNPKDRQFLSAWAQLDPDIDHSVLLRKLLGGGIVEPR